MPPISHLKALDDPISLGYYLFICQCKIAQKLFKDYTIIYLMQEL